jgi:nicotinamidase-related amidase
VPKGAWADYYREWSFILEPGAAPLLELAPPFRDRDLPVIDKTTFSAFGPEMGALMQSAGASALVLCGVSTECCVLATAIAAADAGVPVRIVRDACASVDAVAHEDALHVATVGYAPMIGITTVAEETGGAG